MLIRTVLSIEVLYSIPNKGREQRASLHEAHHPLGSPLTKQSLEFKNFSEISDNGSYSITVPGTVNGTVNGRSKEPLMEPLLGTVIDFREPLLDIDRHHSVYCLTVRPVFSSTRQTTLVLPTLGTWPYIEKRATF